MANIQIGLNIETISEMCRLSRIDPNTEYHRRAMQIPAVEADVIRALSKHGVEAHGSLTGMISVKGIGQETLNAISEGVEGLWGNYFMVTHDATRAYASR